MTTKKKAPRGATGKVSREQLKARAAEIIGDVSGFDIDTRRAVYVALANLNFAETNPQPPTKYTDTRYCERNLREAVGKAEAGETFYDLSDVSEETAAAARVVFDMMEEPNGCPQFIYEALMTVIDEAARRTGLEVWQYTDEDDQLGTGGYSLRVLAALFKRLDGEAIPLEPKRDLAGLISGVLTHDDVPNLVYEKLTDALVQMHDATDVYDDPRAVAALLDYHANQRGEEGAASREQ